MNLDFSIILPILIAFGISVVLSPIVIPFLKKLKFGQFVRDDGPETHLKKSGTPTMGGLIILLSLVITSLFYMKDYPDILPVLFVTLGFGLIGFLDDYIKVVMKRSLGLRAWQKMLGQFVVTAVFAYYIEKYTEINNEIIIPFVGKTVVLDKWVFILCCTWNGKWCKLHRWSGWPCFFRNSIDRYILYSCCDRNRIRSCAYLLCSNGKLVRIPCI